MLLINNLPIFKSLRSSLFVAYTIELTFRDSETASAEENVSDIIVLVIFVDT